MGMTMKLGQVTPGEVMDPDSIDLMDMVMGGRECLDLYKSWQSLHFLFTGEMWGETGVGAKVLMGGTPFGEDMGYGPPRMLRVQEVREVSEFLNQLTDEDLQERFDPEAMAETYAFDSDAEEDEEELLSELVGELREFYANAARQENGVVQMIV